MPKNVSEPSDLVNLETPPVNAVSRKNFLTYAGLSASLILLGTACKKDPHNIPPYDHGHGHGDDGPKEVVNLGSGDIGILNYAYALEQLEAAFYTKVIANPCSGLSTKEMEYLKDIRDHEIGHREFFKNAIGDQRIGGLIPNFSSINFNSRTSVLNAAKAFEDLGVSAYNGAGELIQNTTYLLIAGKIVSVEARHAAAIRDMLEYGSFADSSVIDANGLDAARKPADVLAIAGNFTYTKIIATNLPTS